jgi:hypothetical protein
MAWCWWWVLAGFLAKDRRHIENLGTALTIRLPGVTEVVPLAVFAASADAHGAVDVGRV